MPELPTITFLFTDIEGSTRLWEAHSEAMRSALARHDAILQAAIEDHHGRVFKTIGDAFCAVFPNADTAVRAAIAAQRALRPDVADLRVRMAIHTGEAEERAGDYFGPALNHVARLLSAAHGGQVLLSEAAAQSMGPPIPADLHLRPLGVHRLRDITAREAIFQLLSPGLPGDFPPPNTLDVAFRRGLQRASALAGVIVLAMAGLAGAAIHEAHRAGDEAHRAEHNAKRAEDEAHSARRNLYAADMNLAQQDWEAGNINLALELLEAQRPRPGQEDLRGFEWRYLWRLCQGDQLATFRGGNGSVAFSPRGKTLVDVGGDGFATFWDIATGREVGRLGQRLAGDYAMALSADGGFLATVSNDKEGSGAPGVVKLWDLDKRRPAVTLQGKVNPHRCGMAFSLDHRMLATCGDEPVKLWDVATRREVAVLNGAASARHAAFAPDGKTVAAGGDEGVITLWNISTRQMTATLKKEAVPISCLAFSPDGARLAAAGGNSVTLWNISSRKAEAVLKGHTDPVDAVAFSPDGRTVATASEDNTVRLWSAATHEEIATLRGHRGSVGCVAFSPSGGTIASGSWDGTVKLWSVHQRLDTAAVIRYGATGSFTLSPDGKVLAIADGHTIKLSKVADPRRALTFQGPKAEVDVLLFSPDGRSLATGGSDGTVRLWDVASRREVTVLKGHQAPINGLAFSPDGRTLASASHDRTVRLWDLAARRTICTIKRNPGSSVYQSAVAFSPDSKTLAVGDGDTIRFWDVGARREAARWGGNTGTVFSFVFSPAGNTLAVVTDAVSLWDVPTRRVIATLRGHTFWVNAIAFSPDGKTAAVSDGSSLVLWSMAAEQPVAVLKGHPVAIGYVAFSPDGQTLVSAGGDRTVRVWPAASFSQTDPVRMALIACADRSVTLQWKQVPSAAGYLLYRGLAGAPNGRLVRLTPQPVLGDSFTDRSPALVNGRPQTYAVAPLFPARSGTIEGPRVTIQATPAALPPGFQGYSINESPRYGSVAFDAGAGGITVRGSGEDLWGSADGGYLMAKPVAGDFQATVRALTRPTETDEWAKAGLMVRESLDAGGRNVYLFTTPYHGLISQWRTARDGPTDSIGVIQKPLPGRTTLKLPILLRLTRRGNKIMPEYSANDGRSFDSAGAALRFEQPLPETLSVGLAITSHDVDKISEAKFSDLRIEPLRR